MVGLSHQINSGAMDFMGMSVGGMDVAGLIKSSIMDVCDLRFLLDT